MQYQHWIQFYRARVLLLFKKDAEAVEAFKAALAAKPDFGLAASCLGHHFASRHQAHLAEQWFLEALRIDPTDAIAQFNLGYHYERQKAFAKAVAAFQAAIDLKPKLDQAWYGMGLALAAQNQHEAAAKALEKAAELQPMNPHAWYAMGMAYHTMGNKAKVDEIVAHLGRFDPKMTQQLMRETGRINPSSALLQSHAPTQADK